MNETIEVQFEEQPEKQRRTRRYVEEAFHQIMQKPDIKDLVVLNHRWLPVKSTMPRVASIKFGGLFETVFHRAQTMTQQINADDEVLMLRIRGKINETIILPDENITFMVVQEAQDKFETETVYRNIDISKIIAMNIKSKQFIK